MAIAAPHDLLERLDAILRELAELRAAVAASMPVVASTIVEPNADDLAPEHLLDTTSAQERFGYPRNTLAKWCRTEGLGVMRGGRWLVSVPRLQRHLNGK